MIPGRRFDLLVVGELNVDLILRGGERPTYGQAEQLLDAATLTLGSSSAICACGAARLGLRVAFAGTVGDDLFGRFVLAALAERGVDTAAIRVSPAVATGLSAILVHGDDRAILTYPGSIAVTRAADIDVALLDQAHHLHMGSYFLLDALRPDAPALFAEAQRRGLSTSLDTNYDPSGRWDGVADVLAHCDLFLPNEAELLAIARCPGVDEALEAMARPGLTVVVKRGAAGAVARRGEELVAVPSPVVTPVDTVGAGDSFDAGMLYAHLAGWELGRALRLATACGALSTRAAGGTAAQATLDEAMGAW